MGNELVKWSMCVVCLTNSAEGVFAFKCHAERTAFERGVKDLNRASHKTDNASPDSKEGRIRQ